MPPKPRRSTRAGARPSTRPKAEPSLPQDEGRRMKRLRAVMAKALDKAIGGCSFDVFVSFFPDTIAKEQRDLLCDIYQQIIATLRDNIEREFTAITAEHNMAATFARMDALEDEQPMTDAGVRKAPTNTSTPAAMLRSHLQALKRNEISRLTELVEEAEGKNKELIDGVMQRRAAVVEKARKMSEAVSGLVEAV